MRTEKNRILMMRVKKLLTEWTKWTLGLPLAKPLTRRKSMSKCCRVTAGKGIRDGPD